MPPLALIALLAGLVGACSDSDHGPEIFDVSTGLIHDLHLDAYDLAAWPESMVWDCPGGGQIEMRTHLGPDDSITDLEHEFMSCIGDGLTLSGALDYLRIELCEDGFSIDIEGELEVSGDVEMVCQVDVDEACGGVYSGTACGDSI